MRKSVSLLAVIVLGSIAWLVAQQVSHPPSGSIPPANPSEQKASRSAQTMVAEDVISHVRVRPSVIPVGQSEKLVVTARIDDRDVLPDGVELLQIQPNGATPTVIGGMHREGERYKYRIEFLTNQASPTQLEFEVSATLKDSSTPLVSAPFTVTALAVPQGFEIDQTASAMGGPLAVNNFKNRYLSGGVIPPNGATIDAATMDAPPPPLSNYIVSVELQGANISSTTSVSITSISCTDVVYSDTYSATLAYGNEAIYCPVGTNLYKFYLSFNQGDPNSAQYISAFHSFVNSAISIVEE